VPNAARNFFRSKNKVFGPVQIPKKKLFSTISWGLCTGTKGERAIFSHLVQVQSPLEIEEKNSKKVFFWGFVPVQIPYFWTLKILWDLPVLQKKIRLTDF
jgi:hypothetical protein